MRRHSEVIAALSEEPTGRMAAFEDEDGEALADTFQALLASEGPSGLVTPLADYPELFDVAFGDQIVRARQPTSALRIYGPLGYRALPTPIALSLVALSKACGRRSRAMIRG